MNNSFLENWQFNHKSAPPPAPKDCPYNLTKYESKKNSEILIFQLFNKLGEICKYNQVNIQKSQYSITFMSWKKL